MSYCLKTGGIIHEAGPQRYRECDLHVEGDCIIAVVTRIHDVSEIDRDRVTVTIPSGVDYFLRDVVRSESYGVIVVPIAKCHASELLQRQIREFYSHKHLPFGNIS